MSTRQISETRRRAEAEVLEALRTRPDARAALAALLHQPAPQQAPQQTTASSEPAATLAFSFIFFAGSSGSDAADKYELLHEIARFGDEHGFEAVWIPERHFHPFGGIYSSPVVMAASLAKVTSRIRLRAGSVVLPLHHPITVTEQWAMVDQLSGGRVDLAFASGWNPNDFVLSPEVYPRLREVWLERIESVRALWRGAGITLPNGKGEPAALTIYPRALQPELNVWLTATSRDDTFSEAGRRGYHVLTMLKGISVEELARKIAIYRTARAGAGLDPARGCVTLMLHTLVHEDAEWVKRVTAEPFGEYIRSGLSGHVQAVGAAERPDATTTDRIVEYAAERYARRAALFGAPSTCRAFADELRAIGVNEIACLMDFGVDVASVRASLPHLLALKRTFDKTAAPAPSPRPLIRPASDHHEPIAVVGMGARFPGSPTPDAFWSNLRDGRELITDIPPARWDAGASVTVPRAGLLDQPERFDAARFRITGREAASMDPQQRLFLSVVSEALADAGIEPAALAGSKTAVFVAAYNPDFTVRAASGQVPLDSYSATGTPLFMVANRVSHVFDLRGPSEVINTACSSALVALHRGVRALRSGECDRAIVGGVSLLLSMGRLAGLGQYGILSPEGKCRPFDANTTGQVVGEGAGAVILKPLSAAERDGDAILGVIRGSAVNHHGNRSGSPTLPDAHAQADVILDACRDAGLSFNDIDYIEAHGAGGFGDIVELEAFKRAESLARRDQPPSGSATACLVGTVKPNVGFLEAAGGMSQAIKVLLMFQHRSVPATLNHERCPDGVEIERTRFAIATRSTSWTPRRTTDGRELPRRASLHSYGLGGTNAHLVFEEYPSARVKPAAADTLRVREWTIGSDSPVVVDHQVDGRGLVPAVAYLSFAAETCAPRSGTSWRFEDVFWVSPCFVDAHSTLTLRCEARAKGDGWFFEIASVNGSRELLATGHLRANAGTSIANEPRLLPAAVARTSGSVDGREIYDAPSAIRYGPLFRAIKSARVGGDVVVADLRRPAGESRDSLISPGLIEGALQSARLFAGGTAPVAETFLPFSVAAIEFAGRAPERVQAVVTPRAVNHHSGEGRFDAVLVADGGAWARIEDFCARRQASAESDIERILADLAAGRLTIAEAEQALSPLLAPLSSPMLEPVRDLFGNAGYDRAAIDVRPAVGTSLELVVPDGRVVLERTDLDALLDGRADPAVLALGGGLRFDPPDEVFARAIGDALFCHYNGVHCAKASIGGAIADIYRTGIVTAADGERRSIYPWAIPAAIGVELARLVRTRGCARTLEVGMAYGLASLFICEAHRERGRGHHVAIDPGQRLEFRGIGLLNIERAGLTPHFEFIDAEDASALPALEQRGDRFDFVFIDGLHMFDYTLIDFFYADRLLAAGGLIAFDDAQAPGVARALDFIRANRGYRVVETGLERLVVLEKIEDDTRSLVNPNHFRAF